jgi:hypothetical protein
MPTAYPNASDLRTYLSAFGVVRDEPSFMALGLDGKAKAAWQAWERATDYRPYLATGQAQTRYFDNPGLAAAGLSGALGSVHTLDLFPGLLSVTEVRTGVVAGAGGTVRTQDTEYRLLPLNAAYDGLPYDRLQWGAQGYFISPDGFGRGSAAFGYDGFGYDGAFFGQAGQISVTGVWGRTLALDDDDWDAILQYAAFLCAPQIALMVSKGLYSARDLNFEIRYGGGKEIPLSGQSEMWKANFDAKAALRRRAILL